MEKKREKEHALLTTGRKKEEKKGNIVLEKKERERTIFVQEEKKKEKGKLVFGWRCREKKEDGGPFRRCEKERKGKGKDSFKPQRRKRKSAEEEVSTFHSREGKSYLLFLEKGRNGREKKESIPSFISEKKRKGKKGALSL